MQRGTETITDPERHPRCGAAGMSVLLFAVLVAWVLVACGSTDTTTSTPATSKATPSTDAPPKTTSTTVATSLGVDGARIFQAKCAGCHGPAGEGNVGPSLVGIADRMTAADQMAVVANGRATMLAFSPALTDDQIAAVVDYIRSQMH